MAVTPRCELSAAVNAAAVPIALTGWTNAGLGVSGTAPAIGDFVIVIITSNAASDTVNQTAGTRWTPLNSTGTDLGASVGLTSGIMFKIWDGTETAPTFTWTTGTRNAYSVMALAPDAGNQIYSDVWSAIKKDTTAATTHTPNSVTIPAGFTDCVLTLASAVNSVAAATALTWTASTSYTVAPGSAAGNVGTAAQFTYGAGIQYQRSLTGTQAPAAMTIQGSSTTYAQLQTVAIRQIPLTTAPFQVLQTAYGVNAASVTLANPTSAGSSALIVIASLANTVATVAPSISAMTLGGSADHFAAAKEVSVLGTTFSLANAYYGGIWVDRDCAAGQTAVAATIANSASNTSCGLIVMEVAGISPSAPVDKTISATGNSAAASSGATATTAAADEFLVGVVAGGAGNNSVSGPGPAGNIGLVLSGLMEGGAYSVITAATTATFTAALKSSYCWAAAAVTLLSGIAVHPATLATSASFPAVTVNAGSAVALGGAGATAFDAVGPAGGLGNYDTTGTAGSYAHVNNGNAILVALTNQATSNTVTSVTYGGVALSFLGFGVGGTAGCSIYGRIGGLPTGSNNVVWASTSGTVCAGAESFANAGSFSALFTGTTSSATSVTCNVTGTTSGGLIAAFASFGGGGGGTAMVASSPGTTRISCIGDSAGGGDNLAGGTWASPGGTQAVGFSAATSADSWGLVAVEVKPAAGTGFATSTSFPAVTISAGKAPVLAVSASFPAPAITGTRIPVLAVSATLSGALASKVFPVTVPTLAGDSLICAITVNQVTYAITSIADSKGNVYTLDSSQTAVTPQFYCYRAPGATGGPGGTPTVALTTADTLTIAGNTISSVVDVQLIDVPAAAGRLDQLPAMVVQAASTTTASASATPAQNGELAIAAFGIHQNAVSITGAVGPAILLGTAGTGPWGSSEYLQLGAGTAGVSQTLQLTMNTAAAWRAMIWTFTGNATAAPAVLATSASFPAVTITVGTNATAAPAVLATPASFTAATVSAGSGVTPAALAVSASFAAPALQAGVQLTLPVLAVSASFAAPAVSAGASATVTPAVLAVSASFPARTVTADARITATLLPVSASFAAAANAGSGITTVPLAVTAAFAAPSVDSVRPPLLAAAASFAAPSVDPVQPPPLAISASFPALAASAGSAAAPAVLATSASFPAVTITAGTGAIITPPALAVAAAFSAPAVSTGSAVPVPALAVSASFAAVTITAVSSAAVTPSVLAVSTSFAAPAVSAGSAVPVALLAASASFPAFGVSAGGNATANPSVLAVSASFPAAGISTGTVVIPPSLAATASFAAPQANAGAGTAPPVLAVAAAFAAPAIRADAIISPASLAGSASFPARTLRADAITSPAVLAVAASFSAPSLRADQAAAPALLAVSTSFLAAANAGSGTTTSVLAVAAGFPALTVRAGSVVTTSLLAATAAFPVRTVAAGSGVTLSLLAVSAAFAAPSLQADAVITPALLATSASFPAPGVSAGGNATAIPPLLATSASFPAPAIGTGSAVTVTALATSASFPAVAVSAGSVVTPALLAASASFPARTLRCDQAATLAALAVSAAFTATALHCGETVSPAALAGSAAFAATSLHTGAVAVLAPLAVAASFGAPSVTAQSGATVTPAALAVLASFPVPAVSTSAGATVTPAALATSASFPARAVAAGSAVVPAALAVQASFPAPALAAGSRVTPGVLAVFASFPAPAVSTSAGTTVLPAALLTGTVFPARGIGAGAGVQPSGLILAAVFPAPSVSTGSVVTPAALAALAAFPPLAVGRPVFAVIALTASCSMRVHAASGPDIDALWDAYAIAAAEAQAAHDYWMELRIAGAQAGMAGNAYADLWTKDGEAQRLWHDWLMASEHWSRELAQFAQYGSTPPPGEFAVDALDA